MLFDNVEFARIAVPGGRHETRRIRDLVARGATSRAGGRDDLPAAGDPRPQHVRCPSVSAASYPDIRVAGTMSPPSRLLTSDEEEAVVAEISAAEPDYVWVALEAPKQDQWVAANRSRVNAPVRLAVGAAFDFHAGRRRRAPGWMQHTDTEWLFGLASEPRRLAGPYTRVNLRFARLILAHHLQRRIRRDGDI